MQFETVHIEQDAGQWFINPLSNGYAKVDMPKSEFDEYMRVCQEYADWQEKLRDLVVASKGTPYWATRFYGDEEVEMKHEQH